MMLSYLSHDYWTSVLALSKRNAFDRAMGPFVAETCGFDGWYLI